MYLHLIDESEATLLSVYRGARGPDDIGDGLRAMEEVHSIAQSQGRGALFVIVPEGDWPLPDSRERQRCAGPMGALGVTPNLAAVVTTSAPTRGIITAVAWITKLRAGNRSPTEVYETMDKLLVRVAIYRPSAVAALTRMERELRAPVTLPQRRSA